jgi:HK97 family phage portal protein
VTAIARAVKATSVITNVIQLGGSGAPYTTPISRDIVYGDLLDPGEFKVGGVTVSADKAMKYIPFFAAVRNISEDVAGLPLNVYEKLPGGGRRRDEEHEVDRLLGTAPNPYMTAFTFRETLQSHVLTWGNGYAEIEFATDGSILALWPLRPDRMQVFVDRDLNAVVYRYALGTGGTVDLPRRKVFHVHGLGYDGLVGYSVIERARHMIGMALSAEHYGEDWFEKGGIPPAYLSHPATLSDPARANLRKSIDDGTLSDRHRMALLEEGLDIKTLGIPPKDMTFIETYGMTRSLTATLFRMPPDMLQDIERTTSWGTGVEQQGIKYVKFTLRSHLQRWEQEGNQRLLVDEPTRYLRHVVDALLRGDTAARWQAYRAGADLGVYSIDDILEMEDRNPLPDKLGQQHFVQLNRVPLEELGAMTLRERFEVLGLLNRAGFQADASLEALDLPPIEHTGLEPVTVADQGDFMRKSGETGEDHEARITETFVKSLEALESVAQAAAGRPVEVHTHIDPGAVHVEVTSPPTTIAEGAIQLTLPAPPAAKATNGHRPAIRKTVSRDAAGRITAVLEEEEPD